MVAGDGKLITGGVSQNLCLWSVAGVSHMRSAEDNEKFVFYSLLYSSIHFLFSIHPKLFMSSINAFRKS